MEIERKFLMSELPADWESCPFHRIEQAYLCREPVIRVRRQDDRFILTIKGRGKMVREEHEFPLTEEAYEHLRAKADGNIIRKKRVLIPLPPYTVEMDIFEEPFSDMVLAEVEFPTVEEAEEFVPPAWLGTDVTRDARFQNSSMSRTRYPDHSFFRGIPDVSGGASEEGV